MQLVIGLGPLREATNWRLVPGSVRMGAEVKLSLSLQKARSAWRLHWNGTWGEVRSCRGAAIALKL